MSYAILGESWHLLREIIAVDFGHDRVAGMSNNKYLWGAVDLAHRWNVSIFYGHAKFIHRKFIV